MTDKNDDILEKDDAEQDNELSIEDELNAAYEAQDDGEDDGETDASDNAAADGNDPKPEPDTDDPADDSASDKGSEKPSADSADADGEIKAPINLSADLREDWKNLPDKWKNHFTAREAEVNNVLEEGKNDRILGKNFTNMVQPYIPLMQAEGAQSPLHAVEELMKTVSVLRHGSAQDKATKMAALIGTYGVDINTLDSVLSGQAAPQGGDNQLDPNIASVIDQRLEPVNQLIARMNENARATQTANQQAIHKDIQSFAESNEFYNDVRNTMADFLDVAAQNGQQMTMEQAYEKACAITPAVAEVMATRAKNANLMNGRKSVANKRTAAGSLAPDAEAPSLNKNHTDIEADILDAWDEHMTG